MLVLQILKEEQIYEDCSDTFYEQITKQNNTNKQNEDTSAYESRRSKGKSGSNSKRSHRKFRRKARLKVTYNGLNFGLASLGLKLAAILAFLMLIQIIYYFVWKPGVQRSINLMDVFILGIETWNSFFSLHSSWLSTIVYNNTLPYWAGKTSLEVFDHFKNHVRENLIANYSRAVEYDLGNYTKKFVEGYTTVRILE